MKIEVRRFAEARLPLARWQAVLASTLRRFVAKPYPYEELSVVLVDDRQMRKLNRQHRGIDRATDVLSFDYGEIIISIDTAKRQASEHALSVSDELVLLFTHGLLHTLGFDHEKPGDRLQMSDAEQQLLGFSGLVEKGSRYEQPKKKRVAKRSTRSTKRA